VFWTTKNLFGIKLRDFFIGFPKHPVRVRAFYVTLYIDVPNYGGAGTSFGWSW
jgi:hypothetical protein